MNLATLELQLKAAQYERSTIRAFLKDKFKGSREQRKVFRRRSAVLKRRIDNLKAQIETHPEFSKQNKTTP